MNEAGAEVSVISNSTRTAGSYLLNFNTTDLASGAYHLLFVTPTKRIVKDLMVVK